jgi:hypothetical protein
MTEPEDRTPASPGRQPPFERGNDLAATHGCYSVMKNAKRADEIRERLAADAPFLSPGDASILDVAANLLAHGERGLLVLEHAQRQELEAITEGRSIDPEQRQNLARLSQDVRGWMNSAMKALDALGMTPQARARLGLDVASTRRQLSVIDYYATRREEDAA